jgi:multidrug efflux pump subunit AcrB
VLYGGLVYLTGWSFKQVPTGFVPTQDKQYLIAFAQLPDAASLDRTEAVIRRMGEIGMNTPGIENAVQFPGLSISGFSAAPKYSSFLPKRWSARKQQAISNTGAT